MRIVSTSSKLFLATPIPLAMGDQRSWGDGDVDAVVESVRAHGNGSSPLIVIVVSALAQNEFDHSQAKA